MPLGTVDLVEPGERLSCAVAPLPAYEAIRSLVRAASVALSTAALLGPGEGAGAGAEQRLRTQLTLRRAAELGRALELRDAAGALVPTDYIELTEWPGGHPEIAALIGLRDSHAGVPARVRPPEARSGDAVPPAG